MLRKRGRAGSNLFHGERGLSIERVLRHKLIHSKGMSKRNSS